MGQLLLYVSLCWGTYARVIRNLVIGDFYMGKGVATLWGSRRGSGSLGSEMVKILWFWSKSRQALDI